MANTQRTRADLLNQFGGAPSSLSPKQAMADLIESLAGECAAINVTGSSTGHTVAGSMGLMTLGTATEIAATGDMTTTIATHRLTVANAGVYLVFCKATVAINSNHSTTFQLYKTTVATPAAITGAKSVVTLPTANETTDVVLCSIVTLAAADFVQLYCSGTASDTATASEVTLLALRII